MKTNRSQGDETRHGLELRIAERHDLSRICPRQWDDLSTHALDANPFYSRHYVQAGLATIDRSTRLKALTVHDAGGRLVGFFPFRLSRFPMPVATGAVNVYQMSGLPLLHRDHAEGVVAAWFDAMQQGRVPRRWRFPHVDLDSGFARLCGERSRSAQFDLVPLSRYTRARLHRLDGGFEVHVQTVMSKNRQKGVQRALRRLRELGEVSFEHATEPGAVRRRLEDFLVIEHSGWKGELGTSLLSDPQHARFIREALAANEGASTDTLLLDGRPIAIGINVAAGGTLFTPKCAYDEAFRRFGPGVILEYLVIEAFYQRRDVVEMDAATTVDGHLVEGLWNGTRAMGDVLLGPAGAQTHAVAQVHSVGSQMRTLARALAGERLIAAMRRWRRINPELMRRLSSFGQSATCLLLYV